jgi:pimeloyl-ACP methyl ester carboxylesterase
VLIGASLGGLTSLLFEGEMRPGSARAIAFVDVAPRLEEQGTARISAFMDQPDGFATLEEAADAIAAYNPLRPRPIDLSGLTKNLRLGDDGRYRWHWDPRFIDGTNGPNEVRDFGRLEACSRALRCPVLLVRGRMSDVLSEEGAREFLDLVPHARYADVMGAGHMVAGDRNDAFTEHLVGFLDSLAAT